MAVASSCAQFACCAVTRELSAEEKRGLSCKFDSTEVPGQLVDGAVRCRPPAPLPPADPEKAGLRLRVVGGGGEVLHDGTVSGADLGAADEREAGGAPEAGAGPAGRKLSMRQRLAKSALLPFAIISTSYLLFTVRRRVAGLVCLQLLLSSCTV